MTNNNTFSKVIDKPCSTSRIEVAYTNAIDCILCNSEVIAEYDKILEEVTLYDFDAYYFSNQKVLHEHPADLRTRNRILERIEVEKRLLHDIDADDYYYQIGADENVR